MDKLEQVYNENMRFIDKIGSLTHLQNELRMTDLKMYSVNIEQVYEYMKGFSIFCIVSSDDLINSIKHIKDSHIWPILDGKYYHILDRFVEM